MNYYIYILTNWNRKRLYVGVTNNLEKRMYQHKNKTYKGFTQKYNINKLVYCDYTSNINDAIAREKQIKSWTRLKREKLIESINPEWKELF